jgi:hypothetical protein
MTRRKERGGRVRLIRCRAKGGGREGRRGREGKGREGTEGRSCNELLEMAFGESRREISRV